MAKITQRLTAEYKREAILELLAANLCAWDTARDALSNTDGPDTAKELVKGAWHKTVKTDEAAVYRVRAQTLLDDLAWAGLAVSTSSAKSECELVEALDFLLTIPATRVVELPKPYADA